MAETLRRRQSVGGLYIIYQIESNKYIKYWFIEMLFHSTAQQVYEWFYFLSMLYIYGINHFVNKARIKWETRQHHQHHHQQHTDSKEDRKIIEIILFVVTINFMWFELNKLIHVSQAPQFHWFFFFFVFDFMKRFCSLWKGKAKQSKAPSRKVFPSGNPLPAKRLKEETF